MRSQSRLGLALLAIGLIVTAMFVGLRGRDDVVSGPPGDDRMSPTGTSIDLRSGDRRAPPGSATGAPLREAPARVGVGIRVVAGDGSPVVGARAEVLDDAGMSAHEAWSGAHGDVPLPETLDGRVTGIRVTHPDFAVVERTVCFSRRLSPTIVLASGCLVRLRLTGESRGSSGRLRFAVERPGEVLVGEREIEITEGKGMVGRLSGGLFRALRFGDEDITALNPHAVALPTTGEFELDVAAATASGVAPGRVELNAGSASPAWMRLVDGRTLRTLAETKPGGADAVSALLGTVPSAEVVVLARSASRAAFARVAPQALGSGTISVPWGPQARVSANLPAGAAVLDAQVWIGDLAALEKAIQFGTPRRESDAIVASDAAPHPAVSLRWFGRPEVVGGRVSWSDLPEGCGLLLRLATSIGGFSGTVHRVVDGTIVTLERESRVRVVPDHAGAASSPGFLRITDGGGREVVAGAFSSGGVTVVGLAIDRSYLAVARWDRFEGRARFGGSEEEIRLVTTPLARRVVSATIRFADGVPAAGAPVRFETDDEIAGPVVRADANGRAEGLVSEGMGVTVRCLSPAVRDASVAVAPGEETVLRLVPLTRVLVRWSGPPVVARVELSTPDGRRKAVAGRLTQGGVLALGAWEPADGYSIRVRESDGSVLAERRFSIESSKSLESPQELELAVP